MKSIIRKIEENRKTKEPFLYINNYEIDTLPSIIGELTHLRVLDISRNSIKCLPKEIGNLRNLVIFDLSHNKIQELPIEIGFLKKLENLKLSDNRIVELPLEIINLTAIKFFEIENNPISNPPLEICSRGFLAIGNYFESIGNSLENIKLFEAKLLIVGEGNVGKTQIMNRILSKNEIPLTTEGIEIQKWNFKILKKQFRVNIWDFGGQEIYHATHQFFLTKRSLYLFVWNARTLDYASFDYWLNVIRLIGSDSPVIIVQNKIDERIGNIDDQQLNNSFINIKGYHNVSATKGFNMIGLIDQIKNQISLLDHIGDTLPKVWHDIRIKLESLKRNFITHNEYLTICHDYGLNNKQADYISQYYHDIGVFLHFQVTEVLEDIIFLKPEWATNAVYKLIDTKEIIIGYGKFSYSNLKEYWNDYPPENYIHLIELMKKFELCFEISDTKNYIIPELLSTKRPLFQWDDSDNLFIRYSYEFMPKGIITRFIARNHNIDSDNLFWKNGILLSRDNTNALIIIDDFKRAIDIKITGYNKSRLFGIIERELEYINKTLNYPNVNKLVPCNCIECQQDSSPHFFDYDTLKKFILKGKKFVTCPKSIEDVEIEKLIIGIEKSIPKGSKDGLLLIERLRNCKFGKLGWQEYEIIGVDIFKFLFEEDFSSFIFKEQAVNYDNIFRKDLLVNNNYKFESSFWGRITKDYGSRIIVVEFKNYSEKISIQELLTINKYLNSKIGHFGIIISRKGLNANAIKYQREQISEKRLILSIMDIDLIRMVKMKMSAEDPKKVLDEIYFSLYNKE